jgi:hypothetical protein
MTWLRCIRQHPESRASETATAISQYIILLMQTDLMTTNGKDASSDVVQKNASRDTGKQQDRVGDITDIKCGHVGQFFSRRDILRKLGKEVHNTVVNIGNGKIGGGM